jgi:hypothetical protein
MEFRYRANITSNHARFSLSNHFGEVIHHGPIPESGEIVVTEILPGRYTLWIMDGDVAESTPVLIQPEGAD